MKKGKITYSQETPPSSISSKQIGMADQVANEISKLGIDSTVKYDIGTIDIVVSADTSAKDNGLNVSRFRVFWSPINDNKLRYLGFGIGHSDGYEVKRGWTANLETKDVQTTLQQDITYYNNQIAQRNKFN